MSEQPVAPKRQPKRKQQIIDDHAPWRLTPWEPEIASAVQAMVRGDCPSNLQQRLIAFIIYEMCGAGDLHYRPGGIEQQRDTDFALGKAWVGQQLVKLTKVRINRGGEQG